jgi:hypothetical protein
MIALITAGVKIAAVGESGYLSEHLMQRSLCANKCTGESKVGFTVTCGLHNVQERMK